VFTSCLKSLKCLLKLSEWHLPWSGVCILVPNKNTGHK
jgi:hypothetical protein